MDDVIAIDRMNKQNALNRRLVRKTQDGTLGKSDDGVEEPEDPDAGFQVGDNIHYHYSQPSSGQGNPTPSGLPTWAKVALAAAGLGASSLGGAALASYLSSPGDGTRYEVRLESGETK